MTITNSLHFTADRPLAELLSTLEASSKSHINTTCYLPCYTAFKFWNWQATFLKIMAIPKVLLVSVLKST